MRRLIAICCLVSPALLSSQALPPTEPPDACTLVERFLTRTDEPVQTYRARRRLEARNERLDLMGWMDVRTDLVNATTLVWSTLAEGGSGAIRNKVLKRALDGEAEALRAGDPARAALTTANYTFTHAESPAELAGHRILIDPRRRDRLLVSGSMVVSDPDADLLVVEGRLAKTPSFWTSAVEVVRRYTRLQGVRVPIEMTSRARVRIAGSSTFRMTWEYESINGRSVGEGR